MSTPELYDQLIARSAAGDYEETMNTLKILLKDRKEEPDLRMYSALLRSYADDWQCSAGMIRRTIEEMRAEGIEMDSRACHNILEVCIFNELPIHFSFDVCRHWLFIRTTFFGSKSWNI